MSGRGNLSDREKELRQFDCDICGAKPGKTCRIVMPHPGYSTKGRPTASHVSRQDKLARQKEGGTWQLVFVPD